MDENEKNVACGVFLVLAALFACITIYECHERNVEYRMVEQGYEQATVPGHAGPVWVKAKCQCGAECRCDCSAPVEP